MNCLVFPAIQDHGSIAILGKKPIYFMIIAVSLPLICIYEAERVEWSKELIAYIGKNYVIPKTISHFETKISDISNIFHSNEIVHSLYMQYFHEIIARDRNNCIYYNHRHINFIDMKFVVYFRNFL